MRSVIFPLVKNKGGDLTNVDNYRAIAIPSAVTKTLESVLYCHVNDCLAQTDMQFVFKAAHSTSLCTYAVK